MKNMYKAQIGASSCPKVSGDVPGYVEVECRSWDQAAEELIQKLRDAGVQEGQAWMGGFREDRG